MGGERKRERRKEANRRVRYVCVFFLTFIFSHLCLFHSLGNFLLRFTVGRKCFFRTCILRKRRFELLRCERKNSANLVTEFCGHFYLYLAGLLESSLFLFSLGRKERRKIVLIISHFPKRRKFVLVVSLSLAKQSQLYRCN